MLHDVLGREQEKPTPQEEHKERTADDRAIDPQRPHTPQEEHRECEQGGYCYPRHSRREEQDQCQAQREGK